VYLVGDGLGDGVPLSGSPVRSANEQDHTRSDANEETEGSAQTQHRHLCHIVTRRHGRHVPSLLSHPAYSQRIIIMHGVDVQNVFFLTLKKFCSRFTFSTFFLKFPTFLKNT